MQNKAWRFHHNQIKMAAEMKTARRAPAKFMKPD